MQMEANGGWGEIVSGGCEEEDDDDYDRDGEEDDDDHEKDGDDHPNFPILVRS